MEGSAPGGPSATGEGGNVNTFFKIECAMRSTTPFTFLLPGSSPSSPDIMTCPTNSFHFRGCSRSRSQLLLGQAPPTPSLLDEYHAAVDHSDSVEIAVAPERAFTAIADLTSMGRRSPENTGGEWLDGGPALGAKFRGTNAHGTSSWSTIATVTDYDPPRYFAFDVKFKVMRISRWEFEITPTSTGCRVEERWADHRNSLLRRAADSSLDRAAFTKESIRTTLDRLKDELEGASRPE